MSGRGHPRGFHTTAEPDLAGHLSDWPFGRCVGARYLPPVSASKSRALRERCIGVCPVFTPLQTGLGVSKVAAFVILQRRRDSSNKAIVVSEGWIHQAAPWQLRCATAATQRHPAFGLRLPHAPLHIQPILHRLSYRAPPFLHRPVLRRPAYPASQPAYTYSCALGSATNLGTTRGSL